MNWKQKRVCTIGGGILALLVLFPPYVFTHTPAYSSAITQGPPMKVSGPYRIVFAGTPEVPFPEMPGIDEAYIRSPAFAPYATFKGLPRDQWRVEIDWPRYLIPVFLVVAVTGVIVLQFAGRLPPPPIPPDHLALENYKRWKAEREKPKT